MEKHTREVVLGSSGLRTTALGLGTVPLGNYLGALTDDEAEALVDAVWDQGVRLFDTAPFYGSGLAERRLGAALAKRPRDEFTLVTKVGRLLRSDVPPAKEQFAGPGGKSMFYDIPDLNVQHDYSYDGALRSVEESLERMGMDRVDLVLIHDPDNFPEFYQQSVDGAFPALARLREEGSISGVGVGINQAQMLVDYVRDTDMDCFLLAGRYSLLDHASTIETGLLEAVKREDVGIMLGGVYNSGLLARPESGVTFDYTTAPTDLVERAQALQAVCDRHEVPLMAAAIQFPLAEPGISAVLTGVRSPAEIAQNVEMMNVPIPVELWSELRAEGFIHDAALTPTD
jgi:D-threo-aldose 1-dehydrogenase